MKIMVLADEECKLFWDYFKKEYFEDIDLIISCGDLEADYLSFLVTMTAKPVLYVRGNHDDKYEMKEPEGCVCIEDTIFKYRGIRIMGLGGCMRYNRGINQYTQRQMKGRVRRLFFSLLRNRGIDILVTHAPASGINDASDLCHNGFTAFNDLIRRYKPRYFVHGHIHLTYGYQIPRETQVGETTIINAFDHYVIEI